MSTNKEVVVIRRTKAVTQTDDGGGSWKIAYADFVTAMMAFFLLMWLLGSQSQGDLKGISEYFKNPLKVTMLGGPSSGNSSNVIPGGGSNMEESYGQEQKGDEDLKRIKTAAERSMASAEAKAEAEKMNELQKKLQQKLDDDLKAQSLQDQVKITIVDEGLEIQILDEEGRPMFPGGKSKPLPHLENILETLALVLNEVPNKLSITGHTDAIPYNGPSGYSNWELSADRANAARAMMQKLGLASDKTIRVSGLADTVSIDPDPKASKNRRIAIVVLNEKAERSILRQGGSDQVDQAPPSIDIDEPVPSTGSSIPDLTLEEGSTGPGDSGMVAKSDVSRPWL